ncbi:hypothetical protein [Glycomyces tarimensis]
MNDFELQFIHHARSHELQAEAARERLIATAREGVAGHRRKGLVARIATALRRKEGTAAKAAHRFQLAK